ncbi:MAG TPA: hypothetical protein VEZ48_08500 [Sphingomonadaceae bacterium]|nr:hypothetical protein [Sphingomonadaceae bacterium]
MTSCSSLLLFGAMGNLWKHMFLPPPFGVDFYSLLIGSLGVAAAPRSSNDHSGSRSVVDEALDSLLGRPDAAVAPAEGRKV